MYIKKETVKGLFFYTKMYHEDILSYIHIINELTLKIFSRNEVDLWQLLLIMKRALINLPGECMQKQRASR